MLSCLIWYVQHVNKIKALKNFIGEKKIFPEKLPVKSVIESIQEITIKHTNNNVFLIQSDGLKKEEGK